MMQMAVDIIPQSPHPTSKVAASIAGLDNGGAPFALARPNGWPQAIARHFGYETAIGNSSGTIHAEVACIFASPCTMGATIYLTDPPCPNCAKNIAEAGIAAVYIDHKGYEKDFAQRRRGEFEALSLPVFKAAGIEVVEIWRKDRKIHHILPAFPSALACNPAQIIEPATIAALEARFAEQAFACASIKDDDKMLLSFAGMTCGLGDNTLPFEAGKYSSLQQPINRLLMAARYHGVTIEPMSLYSSRIPTSRELVNLVGAGFDAIAIGDESLSRDPSAQQAFAQLKEAGILSNRHLA